MIGRKVLVFCCALGGATLVSPGSAFAQIFYPPPHRYDLSASLRLHVQPKETEVFVDGYWAGIVDDFDGFFQRLHLEPGDHEIELFLEGHRSFRQKVYLQPHGTFSIRHEMQPLGPGDTPDPKPASRERPERSRRSEFGVLAIRVQPSDAEILIDGEAWERPEEETRLEIELPAGEHRIEIRKDGFATYTRTLRVRPGGRTSINVSLGRE